MITFDEKFFEGEERDGFYIEGEMKRVWAAEMEVLMEIDRICKKYDIAYFADSGTLLGAVRHNGFIPWDDDMDIAMLRSDYMKFISVAPKELTWPLFCADIYHWEGWSEPFARVVNGSGINLTPKHLERYHGCPYSVGVDIFVLDNIPATEEEFNIVISLFEWIWNIKKMFDKKKAQLDSTESSTVKREEENEWDAQIEEQLVKLEEDCKITINREKDIANQLLKVIDGLFAMYGDDESSQVMNLSFAERGQYLVAGRKKEWYRESILLPFENITMPVPVDFKRAVEKCYGTNYLTPVKKWHFHDYPFYKKDKKKLQETRKDVHSINGKMDELEKLLAEK